MPTAAWRRPPSTQAALLALIVAADRPAVGGSGASVRLAWIVVDRRQGRATGGPVDQIEQVVPTEHDACYQESNANEGGGDRKRCTAAAQQNQSCADEASAETSLPNAAPLRAWRPSALGCEGLVVQRSIGDQRTADDGRDQSAQKWKHFHPAHTMVRVQERSRPTHRQMRGAYARGCALMYTAFSRSTLVCV